MKFNANCVDCGWLIQANDYDKFTRLLKEHLEECNAVKK